MFPQAAAVSNMTSFIRHFFAFLFWIIRNFRTSLVWFSIILTVLVGLFFLSPVIAAHSSVESHIALRDLLTEISTLDDTEYLSFVGACKYFLSWLFALIFCTITVLRIFNSKPVELIVIALSAVVALFVLAPKSGETKKIANVREIGAAVIYDPQPNECFVKSQTNGISRLTRIDCVQMVSPGREGR